MKRRLSYLIIAVAIGLSVFLPVTVLAHEDEPSSDGSTSTSAKAKEKKAETSAEFKKRMEDLKAKHKIKLETLAQARLVTKCKPAQAVVGKLHTRFGNSVTKRTQAFESLHKNLDKLVEKLKAKEINTTELEQQIAEMTIKTEAYSTDLETYQQALTDLKSVDCASDPEAFQAALEAARAARKQLVADVTAIRSYLKETIKPTLQSIRQQLADQTTTETETTEEGSN